MVEGLEALFCPKAPLTDFTHICKRYLFSREITLGINSMLFHGYDIPIVSRGPRAEQ